MVSHGITLGFFPSFADSVCTRLSDLLRYRPGRKRDDVLAELLLYGGSTEYVVIYGIMGLAPLDT
jgi:hypothetical protein